MSLLSIPHECVGLEALACGSDSGLVLRCPFGPTPRHPTTSSFGPSRRGPGQRTRTRDCPSQRPERGPCVGRAACPALILLPVARCSFGVFAPLVRAPRLPSCVMCVVTIFSRFVLCVPVSCDRVLNRSVLRSIVPLVSLVSCQEGPFSTQNYKPFFFFR